MKSSLEISGFVDQPIKPAALLDAPGLASWQAQASRMEAVLIGVHRLSKSPRRPVPESCVLRVGVDYREQMGVAIPGNPLAAGSRGPISS